MSSSTRMYNWKSWDERDFLASRTFFKTKYTPKNVQINLPFSKRKYKRCPLKNNRQVEILCGGTIQPAKQIFKKSRINF